MGRIEGLTCFGGESVPSELRSDMVTMNSIQDVEGLVSLVLDQLTTNVEGGALISKVAAFAKEHKMKAGAAEAAVRGLIAILQSCARTGTTASDLEADCIALGLDKTKALGVAAAFAKYTSEKRLQDVDLRQLVDLEWKFGVTCATSESDKPVGKTFLQLKLKLDKNGTLENLYIELTLPQFYDFLANMEKAKAALKQQYVATSSPSS